MQYIVHHSLVEEHRYLFQSERCFLTAHGVDDISEDSSVLLSKDLQINLSM